MAITGIVFDFFGVICSEVAPTWLARHLPEAEAAKVKARFVGAADRGVLSQAALFDELARLTGVPGGSIEAEWCECAQIDERVVRIVQDVANHHPTGLLTNAPSPFVRRLLAENHLESLFDVIIVSSEHGCAKPERQIYEIMLAQLKVAASDVLLIDDNPRNVEGAVAVGMRGLMFVSYEDLKARLPVL